MSGFLRLPVGVLLVAAAAAQIPALRQGVSVQMPITTSAAPMPDADLPDSLIVAVTSRGDVYLEVTKLTPAQLSEKVRAAVAGHPGKRVYVKGDARVPYSTVGEVLDALGTAGMNTPILLAAQHDANDTSYVPPKGLEVLLPPAPDQAQAVTLKTGQGSDAELRKLAGAGRQVLLQVDGKTMFGEVVHAVDVCHAGGSKVILARPGK